MRKTATLPQLPTILIACEGRTEQEFFEGLRAHLHIPTARVVVLGQVGVPKTVVSEAIKKRGSDRLDEAWAVFDRDAHHSWAEAISMATTNSVHLAISNPCFEVWAIMLYRDQTSWIHRHDAQRELHQLHSHYHHDNNPYLKLPEFLDKFGDANARCVALRDRHEEALKSPFENPSSTVPQLVARLYALR